MTLYRDSALLVVDTSVAAAAGTRDATESSVCRSLLRDVLDICHRLVMPAQLRAEWNRHRTVFVRTWFGTMTSRKKVLAAPDLDESWLPALERVGFGDRQLREARKDAVLVSAALATGRIILSLDNNARGHFCRVAEAAPQLRDVVWINPVEARAQVADWLRRGATRDHRWRLG